MEPKTGADVTLTNLSKPTLTVKHKDLQRSGDSAFRSSCPVCKDGLLLVWRDDDMRLLCDDICILCGQRVHYSDIVPNQVCLQYLDDDKHETVPRAADPHRE